MSQSNTRDSSTATYECHECRNRVEAAGFPGPCPECEGPMRNIAVPRE
ncbi:rubrerythrin-like domain-containing protein [Halorussus halobius]|nr:rubrerythrin-like domain-containing protein [Halorussus halobius]